MTFSIYNVMRFFVIRKLIWDLGGPTILIKSSSQLEKDDNLQGDKP